MTLIEVLILIITISFFVAMVDSLVGKSKTKVEKEEEEYRKSLFRCLDRIDSKITEQYDIEKKEPEEFIKEFRDISRKILRLDNNTYSKSATIDNMRLIDSLAYHELNVLKEVNKSLDVGILLTDEKIKDALIEITKGLNKHYTDFCNIKTANVEEETYILKILEQKKSERLDFTDMSLINENRISESKEVQLTKRKNHYME